MALSSIGQKLLNKKQPVNVQNVIDSVQQVTGQQSILPGPDLASPSTFAQTTPQTTQKTAPVNLSPEQVTTEQVIKQAPKGINPALEMVRGTRFEEPVRTFQKPFQFFKPNAEAIINENPGITNKQFSALIDEEFAKNAVDPKTGVSIIDTFNPIFAVGRVSRDKAPKLIDLMKDTLIERLNAPAPRGGEKGFDIDLLTEKETYLDELKDTLNPTQQQINKGLEIARLEGKPVDDIFKNVQSVIDEVEAKYIKDPTTGKFKGSTKAVTPFSLEGDTTTKILNSLEGKTTVDKQFISDLTNKPELKQAERDVIREVLEEFPEGKVNAKEFGEKVQARLLPLNTRTQSTGDNLVTGRKFVGYEETSLPSEIRGNVANYIENIYESPIKNSAGEVHFPGDTDNYFAHTRIEDMADNSTRRVIEVQSDLFQKGRLSEDTITSDIRPQGKDATKLALGNDAGRYNDLRTTPNNLLTQESKAELKALQNRVDEFTQSIKDDVGSSLSQLQPYRNTWWERIVREEVKKAAQDGKSVLQFPTGETAMKIEGLGDNNLWSIGDNADNLLTPDNVKKGLEVRDSGAQRWIITEVLDDGKFKALPKREVDAYIRDFGEMKNTDELKDVAIASQEQFDISGKVDTNNPIYKFYEKDVQKYLTKNYGAKVVTDAQGVKWVEMKVNPRLADKPVEAFAGGIAGIETDEEGNVTFDPVKASLGVLGVGFASRYGGKANEALLKTIKSSRQFAQVESEIYTEMIELSKAGERVIMDDGSVRGIASTFPKWIPEHLRDMKLFEKTLELLERGEMPASHASRQMELYTEVVDEMARRMGIETADNLMNAGPKTKLKKSAVNPDQAIREARTIETRVKGSSESPILIQNATREQVENHQNLINTTKSSSYKDSITKEVKSQEDARVQYNLFENEDDIPDMPEFRRQLSSTLGDVSKLEDISGFKGQARDMYRNSERVFGDQWEKVKKEVFDPFDRAKGSMVDEEKLRLSSLEENVTKLGIKKGSKESAAVMDFGEKLISKDELVRRFGKEKADKVEKAANWFRKEYDSMLDEVNAVRSSIYPTDPSKIIPKRKDYFRHYQELSQGFSGLKNIFETPSLATIDPKLAGISAFTQPKSKWLSFAQQRLGFKSERDAVGGFLNYVPNFAYAKHIDPHIGRFRVLRKELADKTGDSRNLNNYIEALNDYANDLAGKTNPADRYIQTVIPYGRQAFATLTWLNNRVKVNTILGNASSAIAQAFNVPQGIGSAKQHSVYGAVRTIGDIFHDTAIIESNFIKERYKQSAYNKFDVSMLDKGRNFAGWMIGVLDEVGTKFIWNSHYEKAIREGIEEPIQYADEITRKMVAGRGIGEVPLMQKSKVFQLVAPFQLEVGNLWYVLGDSMKKKEFSSIATLFVSMYLMNKAAEEIRGSDVGFDPIQTLYEAYQIGVSDMSVKDKSFKIPGRISGEVLSNVPLGQTVASMYPEWGVKINDFQTPTRSELFGDGDPTRYGSGLLVVKGLQDPLFKILPPFAGGQAKKTLQGLDAYMKGDVVDSKGNKLYSVPGTIPSLTQNALFGKYSTNEARQYFNSKEAKPKIEAELERLYEENQALVADGKEELAQSNVDQLSDEMYEVYKQVKANKKREATNEGVKTMLPVVRQTRALKEEGREDEAQKIVDGMTDEEYRLYELAKSRLKEDDHTEPTTERSLIKTVATYAYAFGTDPVTAFNLMFSGESIRRVDNGAIIVERLPLAESAQIKNDRGAVEGMYLDHTMPLQLGGTNDPTNLRLVDKAVWESYTPVENALGKALRDKKIEKDTAQELILKLKNGSLTADQVLKQIPK